MLFFIYLRAYLCIDKFWQVLSNLMKYQKECYKMVRVKEEREWKKVGIVVTSMVILLGVILFLPNEKEQILV